MPDRILRQPVIAASLPVIAARLLVAAAGHMCLQMWVVYIDISLSDIVLYFWLRIGRETLEMVWPKGLAEPWKQQ